MSPVLKVNTDLPSVPEAPPPPPLPNRSNAPVMGTATAAATAASLTPPTITLPTLSVDISTTASVPSTPAGGSPTRQGMLKPNDQGMRRQRSFGSLLQKFATDQSFAYQWLERDDDDCASIVSMDDTKSVGSSVSGNLSHKGSVVDLSEMGHEAAANAPNSANKAGLSSSSVAQLDKKMEALKLEPGRKNKLSQAIIWSWLTTNKQNPLPEEMEVTEVATGLDKAGVIAARAGGASNVQQGQKVNTEKLRAKLIKTYPNKFRDLNATTPSNW